MGGKNYQSHKGGARMRNKEKKILKSVICILIIFSLMIPMELPVYATQNRTSNYSRAFTLSGNGADDIVSVAKAQVGKTGSQLGYSEEWCADFVSDCAALANQGNVIPRDGYCPNLQSNIIRAGGKPVSISSAQKGDIVFYGPGGANHVEIVYANNNGRISTIGGNSGSGSSCYSRSVRDHSYQTMTITKVLRPNYASARAILPGTVDTSWNVPTNVTASRRISTYDQYGNVESNHYIDPGDNCYISEVYTNGFVKIQYPVSRGKRWAYAKASDFSLKKKEQGNTLPATNIHAWFSAEKMGGEVSNVRLGEYLYLCYRIETKDGNILDSSIGNYSVKETIYYPNGDTYPYSYGKSNNNWIGSQLNQWGTYRGVVEISGDYTGTAEVAYTLTRPKDMVLETWFSKTPMGDAVSYLEKGQSYYMCYGIKCDGKYYFNKYANVDYSVTEAVYGPDGKNVYEYTYDKSDNNWIRFTATQTGTYKGTTTIKGYFNSSDTATCVCKDKSKPKLHNIVIKTYPKKLIYTVGEPLDTSGMVITAYYMDLSYKNITNYKVIGNTAQAGHKYVTVSYTEDGITDTVQFEITVNEKPKEMVTITYDPKGGALSNRTQTGVKNTYDVIMTDKPTKSFQLRFNANGGSTTPNSVTLWQSFKDWDYFNGSVHVHYRGGDKFLMRENSTLSACYEPATIRSLPNVQREGYTFDGWYTVDNQKAYVGMALNSDTTLVAHWTQKKDEIIRDDETDDSNKEDNSNYDDILSGYDDPEEDDEFLEVGDEITTDDAIYTITDLDDYPCVEYTELFDDEITDVVIPDTVAIDGVVYKVTSIASKAFYKNTEIKSVTISSDTTQIGSKAFYGCKSLKKIMILSTKLQSGSIGSKAFSNVAKNVKIHVPREKYKTYKKLLKKAGVGSKAKIYWFVFK